MQSTTAKLHKPVEPSRASPPHVACSREICKQDSTLSTLEHVSAFLQFCISSSDVIFRDIARALEGEKYQLFSLTAKSLLFRMKHSEAEKTLFAWCRRIQQASTDEEIWNAIRAPVSFETKDSASPPRSNNWAIPQAASIEVVDSGSIGNSIVSTYAPGDRPDSFAIGLRYHVFYDIITSPSLPLRAFEFSNAFWRARILSVLDIVAHAHLWNCFRIQSLRTVFNTNVFGRVADAVIRAIHLPIRVVSISLTPTPENHNPTKPGEISKTALPAKFFWTPIFGRENDTVENWPEREIPSVIGYEQARKHLASTTLAEPPKKRQRFPEDGK